MSRIRYFAAALMFLSASSTAAIAQASNDETANLIRQLQSKMRIHFLYSKDGLVPIYKGGVNYQIGDVWNKSLTRLLENSRNCFGELNIRTANDSLPPMQFRTEAAAGFLFRVKKLFDILFHVSAEHVKIVKIKYEGVTAQIVSEGDLRRAYRAAQCPIAGPIIDGKKVGPGRPTPVIIGRLYRGRRDITISYADKAAADARLKEMTSAVAGLPISAGVGAHGELEKSISLVDKMPVPLAFAPAFVTVGAGGGMTKGLPSSSTYVWRPFDSLTGSQKRTALSNIGMQQKWTWR